MEQAGAATASVWTQSLVQIMKKCSWLMNIFLDSQNFGMIESSQDNPPDTSPADCIVICKE
jgi:hypothetical protein